MTAPEHPRKPEGHAVDREPDVEQIHRPIFREPRDPVEGREPPPWWVWAAAVLAIFWGGFYLGRYGGEFGAGVHQAFEATEREVVEEIAEGEAREALDPSARGEAIYGRTCQSCHQADGRGLAGVFPPLRGARWVTGPPERLIAILLYGLTGPIEVQGNVYQGAMPGWGEQLSDEEIAAVATFVRQWEPNAAAAVSPEQVKRVRAATAGRTAPWTAAALEVLVTGPHGDGSS